ncbi:glycoside hydrolase family 32 protein [Nakamurella sp. GG22]
MSPTDPPPVVVSQDGGHVRPRLHFTPERGWLNDPHGIIWAGGEYHLFYQHVPAGTEWAAAVHWGHAVAPDLLRWRRLPIALSPRADEEGCWTGATQLADGVLRILYTSVLADKWDIGRIAVALPDRELLRWERPTDSVLIAGPPDDLAARVFRDPCLVRTERGWSMVVGAGVTDGTGLAVQYTSADGENWTYGGVLCSRSSADVDGVWTGTMWECPQLFRVGADWVLVVSVWDKDTLYYVAGAVGRYDGVMFTAERWSRLTHDETAYAMTSFTDSVGRPCVMSWLREDPSQAPVSKPWAGALSLPMVVEVGHDRTVRLRPHPDLEALRRDVPISHDAGRGGLVVAGGSRGLDIELPGRRPDWRVALTAGHDEVLAIEASPEEGRLTITRPGLGEAATVPATADVIRVVIDAGIVEIFAGDGCSALRVPADRETDVVVSGVDPGQLTIHRLEPAITG